MATTNDAITGDVLRSAYFMIEIGPVTGYFTEVSGLGSENEVIEHKIMAKGAKEFIVRKIPGRMKWGDITLKRGITANMDMWTWRKQVEQGQVDTARTDGTITMLDTEANPVASWEFTKGWPSKITTPALTADSNAVGVEEIVIVHEGITRVS